MATAIIAIIVTIALASYRVGGRSSELQQAALRLAGDIRKAQSMAMSSQKYEGEVPCGYGIHFMSNDSYFIFRDVDGDEYCENNNRSYDSVLGEEIGSVNNLSYNVALDAYVNDIFFMPPDARVFFDGLETINTVEIRVLDKHDPTRFKTIRVNNFGLVEIR